MLIVISPAKKLDFDQKAIITHSSTNDFLPEAETLVKTLKKYSPKKIEKLMDISSNLAHLNHERFDTWALPFNTENAKQAIFAFVGDVYIGIDAKTMSEKELLSTQNHLRILSGLYGVLRPLDLIQPYRLVMGTKLKTPKFKDLYAFWGDKLTEKINEALVAQGDDVLINLASNEYFKSLNKNKLKAKIVTPIFKDFKNNEYKVISFFAKKARGLMSRFILQNELKSQDELKYFDSEGYYFSETESSMNEMIFLRR